MVFSKSNLKKTLYMELYWTFSMQCVQKHLLHSLERLKPGAFEQILSVVKRWRKLLGAGMRLTWSCGSMKKVPVCMCLRVFLNSVHSAIKKQKTKHEI